MQTNMLVHGSSSLLDGANKEILEYVTTFYF